MTIKINSAQCGHCKDILVSRFGHDWVCCSCWNKSEYNTETSKLHGIFIDGGNNYMRYGYTVESEFINLTQYNEE